MPRTDKSFHQLPAGVQSALAEAGGAIRVARLRRRQSARDFASRLGVTLPTLRKLERGEPGVALATFASALWLIGLLDRFRDLARPESDVLGNIIETARLPRRVRRTHDKSTASEVFVHARLPDGSSALTGRFRFARDLADRNVGEFRYAASWLRNEHGRSFPLDPVNLPLSPDNLPHHRPRRPVRRARRHHA